MTVTCRVCKEDKPLDECVKKSRLPLGVEKICKRCSNDAAKARGPKSPEKRHGEYVKYSDEYYQYNRTQKLKKFNLTIEQYDKILEDQKGVCAICEGKEARVSEQSRNYMLAVDHDHETGVVRGLLCGKCNKGLGLLGDTEESLSKALEYLRRK